MSKYEEIIKVLRCCAKGDCIGCPYLNGTCPHNGQMMIQAANAIEVLATQREADLARIEHDRTLYAQRWISAEKELPEPWKPVLVTYLGYNTHMPKTDMLAYIDSDDGGWYLYDDDEHSGRKCRVIITHWMPLPPPGKE